MAASKLKSPDEGIQLSSDPNKDPSKPSVLDHGEESELNRKLRERQEEIANDPLLLIPAQMREGVDPGKADDERSEAPSRVDPLNPALSQEPPKGGTLPPA